SQKVPDVNRKPKTSSQMLDNVGACLTQVERLGVALEGISTRDVRDGNLKAILGLFFALSKHKQQQKQIERDKMQRLSDHTHSRLPSPFHGGQQGGQTSIPTPLLHRSPAVQVQGNVALKCPSASSSRSTSPSHSFIPTPRVTNRTSLNEKQLTSTRAGGIARNSPTTVSSPYNSPSNKNSMLDKFKLFNSKEKNKPGTGSTKRTSSSSGFSSARSERSDSSTSLYSDVKSGIPDKRESGQNDLNSLKTGLKKKVVKGNPGGETRIVRIPSKSAINRASGKVDPNSTEKPNDEHAVPIQHGLQQQQQQQMHNQNQQQMHQHNQIQYIQQPQQHQIQHQTQNQLQKHQEKLLLQQQIHQKQQLLHHQQQQLQHRQQQQRIQQQQQQYHQQQSNLQYQQNVNQAHMNNQHYQQADQVPVTSTVENHHQQQPVVSNHVSSPVQSPKEQKPVEKSMEEQTKMSSSASSEPLRIAGGSGIPKPTAAVKGTAKPMHPVAPMQCQKGDDDLVKPENKLFLVVECSDEKQQVQEEEETAVNVKPMQPLLRGYKRSIAISPRMLHYAGAQNYRTVPRVPDYYSHRGMVEERGMGDGDYMNIDIASGYMSDGDLLQTTETNDMLDGYMSEGGAPFYKLQQEQRSSSGNRLEPIRSAVRPKVGLQPERVNSGRKVPNAVGELSTNENHIQKLVGVSSGAGGGGGGVSRGPSPPEPQPQPPVVYRVVGSRSHIKKADSSQQTENSAFRQVSNTQWKKYVEGTGLQRGRTELEVVRSRDKRSTTSNGLSRKPDKKRSGSKEELGVSEVDLCNGGGGSSKGVGKGGGGGKVRGVPPSFGYVKRPINGANGKATGGETRTAQVKVSGGTQTDLKVYSSGGGGGVAAPGSPGGGQLTASVRERLFQGSQSLPKSRTPHPHAERERDSGSLSDSNYADLASLSSPYSSWLRHTSAYTASLPARATTVGMVEADSIESLPAQLHHRASLTHTRILGSGSPNPSHRLSRSNSIRSTKSEKLYPSMLQRSEEAEPYYSIPYNIQAGHHSSQPTSPTPSQMSQGTPNRFNYPLSPISASPSTHGIGRPPQYVGLFSKSNNKDDDVHGSAVSLVSTASSLYSTPEEKQAHELRKLRRELGDAQEKVQTLTSQLSTNAHVVSAFEQSLSNMTQRLQQLTATAEKKDSELKELRQTIDLLRKQSQEAGLTGCGSPSLARRHTINTTEAANGSNISRQLSTDSVSSLTSLSSACSLSSTAHNDSGGDKKKKRGWLRSSFNKAFSRSKKTKNGGGGGLSDAEGDAKGGHSDVSAPSSPLLNSPHHMNGTDHHPSSSSSPTANGGQPIKASQSSSAIYERESGPEVVEELRKQLREKDLVLTDIRLEALSSAHQLESLKDTVIKMRNEMLNLKQDNERLQRIVTSKSLTSSQSSLPMNDSLERRFSMTDAVSTDHRTEFFAGDPDGKRVCLYVYLGSHGSYHKYVEDATTVPIGIISVSTKTNWELLDSIVRRAFKEYIDRIDSSLGLCADSVCSYQVGEVVRLSSSSQLQPELLPCGYLVGAATASITICLKGALNSAQQMDALTFTTLIPKPIVQRYVSLLSEHRRIILCGPSGTGKSYLANKLAEFLVLRAGKDANAESIATFNVDHKSSKELRQYLSNVAEQCETSASDLPSVIILDNLHNAASLADVFNGFLSAKYAKCPFIIGTMNQATCSTTNLQLHHNFRWVLCANHMEPVKGFLGRYLRRRLTEAECQSGYRNNDLARIVDWMPRVWNHLNQFLEAHSSSDVTIGPRLFLSCPMDIDGSQVWFTDLWNYSLVPYLLEAVREGLQLYGRRAPWEDPAHFITQTYPWTQEPVHGGADSLIRLRPEDVGYDLQAVGGGSSGAGASSVKSMSSTQSDNDGDPLLNMLMRLQEAANYSNPHSNDSDSNLNSDNIQNSGSESTL
ncbi:hypothetical protein LSTR_LSTR002407, partial [Laodelphax striatellus]